MYCPKCGVQNIDTANFCRTCGNDVSSVLQATTDRLAEAQPDEPNKANHRIDISKSKRRKDNRIFLSLCFVVISIALWALGTGRGPWFLLGIPVFIVTYGAIEKIIGGNAQRNLDSGSGVIGAPVAPSTNQLLPDDPSTIIAPSVTEITTRHLDSASDSLRGSQ